MVLLHLAFEAISLSLSLPALSTTFCHTNVCWLLRWASWDDWQLFALTSAYERDPWAPVDATGRRAPVLLPAMLQSPPKWTTFVPKHNTGLSPSLPNREERHNPLFQIPLDHIFYIHPVVHWDKSSVQIFLSCSIFTRLKTSPPSLTYPSIYPSVPASCQVKSSLPRHSEPCLPSRTPRPGSH